MPSMSSTPKPKIIVTDSSVWVPKLYQIGDVYQNSDIGAMPREKLIEHIADAEAIFCLVRDKIDKTLLDKVIATMSVGFDHLDLDECKKRYRIKAITIFSGIRIGYTPGILTETTAELGIALLLATSRRIIEASNAARSGEWKQWTPYFMCGKSIQSSVIGFYGMGQIGRNMAEKLLAFKPAKIIYHNRKPIEGKIRNYFYISDDKYHYVSFDALLTSSDFLIITALSTSENFQIFNKKTFKRMKNKSTLINLARFV